MAPNTFVTISLASLAVAYLNRKLGVIGLGFWSTCLSTLAIQTIPYCIYRLWVYPRLFHPLRYVPKATGSHPIWGYIVTLVNTPLGLPHVKWIEEQKEKTDFLYFSFAGSDRLVTSSSRAAAEVLQAHTEDISQSKVMIDLFERGMGRTILTAGGAQHKELRKNFLPAFAPDHLRRLAPDVWKSALRLRDSVANVVSGSDDASKSIDFWPLVHDGAMRMLLETALSIDLDNDPMGRELLESYHTLLPIEQDTSLFDKLVLLAQCFFLPHSWGLRCSKRIRDGHESHQTVSRIYKNLVETRTSAEKQSSVNDLLDKMCQREYNRVSENAVRQLNALMAAGHETTACGTIWALLELAKNPKIQAKVRAEISAAIPDPSSEEADATKIDSLPFLNSFILEIFRLYPSLPLLQKETRRDIIICNQRIPEGTQIQIPVYALNRSKEVWGPSADELRPERWTKENGTTDGQDLGMPPASLKNLHSFAQGPRSCPGREFATRSMKYFVASLLLSFEFETAPGESPEFAKGLPSLRPFGGLQLRARRIDLE